MKVRVLAALGLALSASAAPACSQTPQEQPERTLERAERLAALCLKVVDEKGERLAVAEPAPELACNGAPLGTERGYGEGYPYHYFALATQTLRGELGVIDLTIYRPVDIDKSTPGFNFVPVGETPTDVATTPDSRWAFVASAAPTKPGLYAIPSTFVVNNAASNFVPNLTDLIGCSLPAAPSGLAVVPNGSGSASPYDVVVVLPGDRLTPARVVGIDTASFADPRGDQTPEEPSDAGADGGTGPRPAGPQLTPGSFDACPIKYQIEATVAPPPPAMADREWSDGIAYRENGGLTSDFYPLAPSCGGSSSGDADAGSDVDGGTSQSDAGEGGPLLPPMPARFGRSAQDGTTLYVADLDNPIIHVFDLSVSPPVELPPLEVVSSADPSGQSSVRDIAVSPATRNYQRFLYAVEAAQGSLLVYDVTDKNAEYRKPLVRPHAELQPFQPVDRILFGSPVNTVSFARHDVPLDALQGPAAYSNGALCNPNPDADGDPGAFYTGDAPVKESPLGPKRLRGVFGFAALANGQIVVLDVDDWDAPCRRPANVSETPRASSISEPQIATPADPYGVPLLDGANINKVTREAYFPVSAPHRLRSQYFLRNESDAEGGDRVPRVPGGVTLSLGSTPLDTTGSEAFRNPLLLPTATSLADPSGAPASAAAPRQTGVRMSYEAPDVHVDQDWAVAYEGALPFFDGVRGQLSTTDDYQTLSLDTRDANFCALGVHDVRLAREQATAFNEALLAEAGLEGDPLLLERVGDYVQIADELLPEYDGYWALGDNDCWGEIDRAGAIEPNLGGPARGLARRQVCQQVFGSVADNLTTRDLPILEVRGGSMVLGRYQYPAGTENSVRERRVIGADLSNRGVLSAAQCCFHNQISFHLRAGGTWLAFGSASGYLHHLVSNEDGTCGQSCESRERLLNSRIFALPRAVLDRGFAPGRSSRLAMRNPMFSYFLVDGQEGATRLRPERDVVWRFATRNQFAAMAFSLTKSEISANPRSMRFLPPLGQVAVLDGAQQGLTLIDLRTAAFADAPVY